LKRGRVHWYSKNLGHGFIVPEDEGPQVFVLREDIVADEEVNLENNDDEVSYEEIRGTEEPEASKVYRV
jgi:cold shock CspA family protein